MRSKEKHRTVVEKIREDLCAQVHHVVIAAVVGEPSVLRIEGPAASNGAAQRAVVGHERSLRRAGFLVVECLGVDLEDPRARQGRWWAIVPEDAQPWQWERLSGEALQERIMRGDDVRTRPRVAVAAPIATVHSLAARRAKKR
jgi:hypothetical protein